MAAPEGLLSKVVPAARRWRGDAAGGLNGLMCGVATLLLLASLRPALGLARDTAWMDALAQVRPLATLVFAISLGLCFWLQGRFPRLPGPALAMLAGTLAHHLLALGAGADAMGATAHAIDSLVPEYALWRHVVDHGPAALFEWLPLLAPYALAIAALASLESLLSLPLIEEVTNRRVELLRQTSGTGTGPTALSILQTSLAEGMGEAQGRLLEGYLERRSCAAGKQIFAIGEAGSSLFVITDSVVDIVLPLENGRSKRIASFAPGVVFGEMALLDSKPRSANAIVQNAGTAWELTRARLTEIEGAHPEIARQIQLNLSRSLAERLRLTTMELRAETDR